MGSPWLGMGGGGWVWWCDSMQPPAASYGLESESLFETLPSDIVLVPEENRRCDRPYSGSSAIPPACAWRLCVGWLAPGGCVWDALAPCGWLGNAGALRIAGRGL
jgi:hypothetical protein